MNGKTHAVHGAMWGLGVGLLAPSPAQLVACVGLGAIAGFGPDVDHKPAPAGRMLPPVRWAVHGLSRMVGLPMHRGLSHTVVFALAVGASTLWLLPWVLSLAITAGWLAALAGDWCTKTSLPYLWWPLTSTSEHKRVSHKALRIHTGKRMERWVVYPISVVSLVFALFVALVWIPA